MKEIAAALAKAQAEFKPAVFDKRNPHFGSPYASLTSVMNSVKDALSKNGLAVSQSVVNNSVVTRLIHSSGETLETSVPLLLGKQDMQGLGSAITYGRRYGISALLGIVTDEDDDGNAASAGNESKPESKHAQKQPTQPRRDSNPLEASGAYCEACGTGLILSKSGAGYYCPKFKDTSMGEHSRLKADDLQDFKMKQEMKNQQDIPF